MRAFKNKFFIFGAMIVCGLFGFVAITIAANGAIDATDRYAWSENAGWLDFGTSQGNVVVGDSFLTGYAWGENIGWVSLNCSNDNSCAIVNYKVANDGSGNLSGYAWTENAGWIDFNPAGGGVAIDSSGQFSGYAWGENIGWVSLNCSNTSSCATVDYKVANNGNGTLSGYAWGENIGWINFAPAGGGVSIGATGDFSGYAWGENIGWIVFNCATTNSCAAANYKVATDWAPRSSSAVGSVGQPGQYSVPVAAQKKLAWANPKASPDQIVPSTFAPGQKGITPELRKIIEAKIAEIIAKIAVLQKQLELLLAAKP